MRKKMKDSGLLNRTFRIVKEESCVANLIDHKKEGLGIHLDTDSGLHVFVFLPDVIREGSITTGKGGIETWQAVK